MSLSEVIANTVSVCEGAGYTKADFRTPLEKQSHGGVDRRFQVVSGAVAQTLARHAQPGQFGDIRTATMTVRVAYVRLGGDKGGPAHGGDSFDVNIRAFDDMLAICPRLESDLLYDAQNSGLRRRSLSPSGFQQTFEDERMEIWDAAFTCEFEEPQDPRAVAA